MSRINSRSKKPRRRNPAAHAVRTGKRFHVRVVPNGKLYRRRSKHSKRVIEGAGDER